MKLTQQAGFGNTPMFGKVTYRDLAVYLGSGGLGILLAMTSLFRYNWVALLGYVAFVSIILGQTPTGRSMAKNIYGIILKKPIRMVVTSLATSTTIGHGIRAIEKEDDQEAYGMKMLDGNIALVYVATSGINNWSTYDDYDRQATQMKTFFNVLEGGEGLRIVVKHDDDTGMMALKEHLDTLEHFEPSDDLQALSAKRKQLLVTAATSPVGRSVQQYLVLMVKPKNVKRCLNALKETARLIRPADYPVDVLLAAAGYEGGPKEEGVIIHEETREKDKRKL